MGAEPETERLKEIGSRLARASLSLTRYVATAGPGLTVALFLLILHYFPPPFVGSISNLVFECVPRFATQNSCLNLECVYFIVRSESHCLCLRSIGRPKCVVLAQYVQD